MKKLTLMVPRTLVKLHYLRLDGYIKEFNEEEYLVVDPKERKID
ncbi:hypothetical protein [Alphaproteobacteria bacterium endosymbiont of Tiliacea citrago]